MAAPSNRFACVTEPDPAAITVTLRPNGPGAARGEVVGPAGGSSQAFAMGQDGSLSAPHALAVACHLANQIDRPVVVRDDSGLWQPQWGRLERG